MASKLNPYLSFKDNAREAMEFYKTVFSGELQVNTFKDFNSSHAPNDDDKIMHSQLEAKNGIVFMAADTPTGMEHKAGTSVSMSLSGEDDEELADYFKKLSEGATIMMPLEKAPWGDKFGMLVDKFGIQWMVNVTAPK